MMVEKSIINILDDSYTQPSPGLDCHWNIQKIDKNRCVKICARLKAYGNDQAYAHLPYPPIEKLQKVEEENECPPICEICKIEGRSRIAKIRGLCVSCYASWQVDRKKHPTQGKFIRKQKVGKGKAKKRKDITPKSTRTGKKKEKIGIDMSKMPKTSWSVNNLNKLKEKKQPEKKLPDIKISPKRERKDPPPVKLYLTRYPKIKNFLLSESEKLGLPFSHVAISLLAEAIQAREKKNE
jgi:hypothetical protein